MQLMQLMVKIFNVPHLCNVDNLCGSTYELKKIECLFFFNWTFTTD